MNIGQAFKIAAKSIAAKKGRSALTMLGIIIGLAAVIILVSYAEGQNKWMKDYYESMGTNKITISANSWNGKAISDSLYNYCMNLDDLVLGVTPTVGFYNNNANIIKYGAKTLGADNNDWQNRPNVVGGNQQYSLCSNYTLSKGRDITYLDVENYNQVCVLGYTIAEQLFNYIDPVGKTITIGGKPFEVVGVFTQKDPNNMTGMDRTVLVPYTMSRLLNGNTEMSDFVAKAKDAASTTKAITMLDGYLKGLVGEHGNYYVQSENQWQEESNEQNAMQQRFLGGIAGISLLVGGIGIMNIMLVTVTERTREIGIRKAIGAERKSIIAQFLIEACMICGIGGFFGIVTGYLGTLIVCKLLLGFIVWPSAAVTAGAFTFSVIMGVVFGLYPAIKASGLQPVVALRAE